MPADLDYNVKTCSTSMLRNQRNLWFSDKFKIDKELENLFSPSRLLKSILLPGRKACTTVHCTSTNCGEPPGSVASSAVVEQVICYLSIALDIENHEEKYG